MRWRGGRIGGEQDAEKDRTTEGVTPSVLSCSSNSAVFQGEFRISDCSQSCHCHKKQQLNSNKTRTTNAKYNYNRHTIENILMVKKERQFNINDNTKCAHLPNTLLFQSDNYYRKKVPYPLNSRMFCSVIMNKFAFFLAVYVLGSCFRTPATLFFLIIITIILMWNIFFTILTFIPVAVWLIFWKPAAFLR